MHSVQSPETLCSKVQLRSQGMVPCTMHMLELPTSFIRPPPKQDVLHHQGRSPTEGQSHFLQGEQDGLSVVGDTWMRQLGQGEGGGVWAYY